jgi:adenine-specific DNA-methyltransferase
LQETMLALFQRKPNEARSVVHVNFIRATEANQPVTVEPVGQTALKDTNGDPWLLPRSASQVELIEQIGSMRHRLADYGLAVSTGQLVWNRHKKQLRANYQRDCYPIIWAEAVNPDGTFHFQAARHTHLPYLKIEREQDFLINHEPCILVQRTTAKEQKRRLIAAVIPNSFVLDYPGFVVENHLNMVYFCSPKPSVALRTVATLLNSAILDQAFRCVNGSVAVSAYELNALPLPNPEQMAQLQEAVFAGTNLSELETMIAQFYTLPNERKHSVASDYSRQNNRRVAA